MEQKEFLEKIKSHEKVQEMKKYTQHGQVSTYRHCERVAELCSRINNRLHLGADEEILQTGAMLHDFYLYDWHNKDQGEHGLHGFSHADTACKNADKYFKVNDHVKEVIRSHMWPLNITRIPRSREAWIVCAADKVISIEETLFNRKRKNDAASG